MENNSYVNLSLEKYNELYDKAKKEDTEQDSKYDVELIEDCDYIPKGAKGINLQPDSDYPFVEWDKHYSNCYSKKIDCITYENVWAVSRSNLKSINNKEEK